MQVTDLHTWKTKNLKALDKKKNSAVDKCIYQNKKLKSTGQKNSAVDKCTNQLNTFSDVLVVFFPNSGYVFSPIFSYYVNGRSATRRDFLSPEVLDTFATAIYEVLEVPCPVQSFPCSFSRGLAENPK